MNRIITKGTIASIVVFAIISCAVDETTDTFASFETKKDVNFDVVISKDGRIGTRADGGYDNLVTESDQEAKLDPNKPFGLMGIDPNNNSILINNERVLERSGMKHVRTEARGLAVGDMTFDKLIYEYRRP